MSSEPIESVGQPINPPISPPINQEQLALIGKQLADIEMPAEPNWAPVYLVIGLLVFVTVVATALQLRHRQRQLTPDATSQSPMQQALTKLDELESSWREESCDTQTLGFRLATTLRMGLKLNRLEPEPPTALTVDEKEWQQLYQCLYQLRYHSSADAQLINQALFEQIRRYINLGHNTASC